MTKAKKNGNIPPLGMLFYIIYEIEAYQIEILGKPFLLFLQGILFVNCPSQHYYVERNTLLYDEVCYGNNSGN